MFDFTTQCIQKKTFVKPCKGVVPGFEWLEILGINLPKKHNLGYCRSYWSVNSITYFIIYYNGLHHCFTLNLIDCSILHIRKWKKRHVLVFLSASWNTFENYEPSLKENLCDKRQKRTWAKAKSKPQWG